MDQEQWEKVDQIVDTALELQGDQRTAFIREQCGSDDDLRSQVTQLLEAIEKSSTQAIQGDIDDFISEIVDDGSPQNPNKASSLLGETIDKYEIISLLGHGGMGSVFLAKRADKAYDKQVAVKILRRGMDTPSNKARFKRERNILANLDHPNIARLLDGGVTESGLPYLVMEYVDGKPLLEYCDNHRLPIDKRLTLFRDVCAAVQHAHRNATIHRDLKPSNILVTKDGTVKILDFGIAKLLDPDNSDQSLYQTQTTARILTLAYAAPEQVENKPITTATDSYTLGLLMFELLTGCHPFDLEDCDFTSSEDKIRNQQPLKPSTKLNGLSKEEQKFVASRRQTTVSKLSSDLQGDLDAIIMKALRKEAEGRYPSVEQLLEDLNRHENSLPLIAQSDTLSYRLGKFINRNKRAIAGILLILIAILGFGSYHIEQVTEERNIAEQEAQKAQTVKAFLVDVFRSSNPRSMQYKGKDLTARELLVNGENAIGRKLKSQPDVYTEIVLAIGDAFTNIDEFEKAENSYQKALTQIPNTADPVENKIRTYVKLGNLKCIWTKDSTAFVPARKAQKLLHTIDNPEPQLAASVAGLMGRVNVLTEDYDKANNYYQRADSIYTQTEQSRNFDYIQMLNGYGKMLIYSANPAKAEEMLSKSRRLHQSVVSTPTMTLVRNYKFLGWAERDMGNFQESNRYFNKSIELSSQLNSAQSMSTALAMYHLSINQVLAANYQEGEKMAQNVLSIYKNLLDSNNDYIQHPKKYIAIAKYKQGEFAEAERWLHEIITRRTELRGKNNIGLAAPYAHLGMIYHQTNRSQKAISALKKSLQIYEQNIGSNNARIARSLLKLGSIYRDLGNYDLAKEHFRRVKAIQEEVLSDKNHQQANYYYEYGKFLQQTDHSQMARRNVKKAYQIYRDAFGKESPKTKKAKSYLKQLARA